MSAQRGSIDACNDHEKVVPQKKDYRNIVKHTVSLGAVKMHDLG
jgi:hypothetical protein